MQKKRMACTFIIINKKFTNSGFRCAAADSGVFSLLMVFHFGTFRIYFEVLGHFYMPHICEPMARYIGAIKEKRSLPVVERGPLRGSSPPYSRTYSRTIRAIRASGQPDQTRKIAGYPGYIRRSSPHEAGGGTIWRVQNAV